MYTSFETEIPLAPSTEICKLGAMHLKRFWGKIQLKKEGKIGQNSFKNEWQTDITLLNALGLGLEPTLKYIYANNTSFEDFEDWISGVTGGPDPDKIANFNQTVSGGETKPEFDDEEDVLMPEDIAFWEENGYVIIRNAVSREFCEEAVALICESIGVDRYDSSTWYGDNKLRQGIMVQLFQHPVLQRNRTAFRIRRAFEQLWRRKDIWVNTDRVGFNPPETDTYLFPGPRLHWDVSIKQPIPFGTQGILYLADTADNQGAFTLIPGFQHKIADWLKSLPQGANPRQQNLYALGPKPIAASAGDFILWHQALPHGSSPNTASLPRFVQYINYEPADHHESDEWI